MTRSELVSRLAARYPALYLREIERAVDVMFDEITKSLARGERVELRGFGSFGVKDRQGRAARNPRNGQKVQVEAKRVPFFRMGKKLFDELN